jgi:hypothetical protein
VRLPGCAITSTSIDFSFEFQNLGGIIASGRAMKPIFSLIFLFALGSFVLASDKSRDAQIDDIREALFRHQFVGGGIRFLSLGEKGKDPSNQFMKRFADSRFPVRKVSSCKSAPHTGVPTDKKTGATGTIYSISTIKWISDTEVETHGGCYMSKLGSDWNSYTLKKENGSWKVIKERLIVIS